MIIQSKENPNSHLTVKERVKPSLPITVLIERKKLAGSILDFGCGLGTDVEYLKSLGMNIQGYDPYYFPKFPAEKFDIIICNYVLNVLLPEEQSHVLMAISELLKPSGKAYYCVRRDIKRNGFLYNPKQKVMTYQCNVILTYKSIFKTENCEMYEYEHYTKTQVGFKDMKLITESATAIALIDIQEKYILIKSKRDVQDFFKLTVHEQMGCIMVLNRLKVFLYEKYFKNSFEIQLNNEQYFNANFLIKLKN